METRLRTGSCFYSTCLSPELHPILPNLINSTPGSSVNFHLVDIFTKSCISQIISLTFLTQRHTEFHFLSLREVGTKERLWHFVIAQQYAATKTDSFSNIQIRKISFQKYNITCKGARITRGRAAWMMACPIDATFTSSLLARIPSSKSFSVWGRKFAFVSASVSIKG